MDCKIRFDCVGNNCLPSLGGPACMHNALGRKIILRAFHTQLSSAATNQERVTNAATN